MDLLPDKVSIDRVKVWIRREASRLNLKYKDIFLISSAKGTGIGELTYEIQKEYGKRMKDIFVMGCSNSGKSTFINHMIQKFRLSEKQSKPVTSPIPGTTMSIISIPLPSGLFLYDTPGIHSPKQIVNLLTPKEIRMILPKKRIRPQVYK